MAPDEFDAKRLTLARWSVGMTKRDLADRVDVSAASVSQYEAENTRPPQGVVSRIALALGVPVAYFYSDPGRRRPRLEARSFFRSLRSTRQWQRDQADAIAEHLYDLVGFLELKLRLPPVVIPSIPVSVDAPSRRAIETAAQEVRASWALPDGPVSNVVRLLEAHGAVLARLPELAQAVDAFSRWFERRPIVLLSSQKQDKGRSRFDAAHELGHLVIHYEPEPGNRALERQAHAFAAAFLMPAEQIVTSLPRRLTRPEDWETLFDARARWGVSAAALLYRSQELEVLSNSAFRRAMTFLSKRGLRCHDGEVLGAPEQPKLIHDAVEKLQDDFGLGVKDLADALRLSEKQMNDILGQRATATTPRAAPEGSGRLVAT